MLDVNDFIADRGGDPKKIKESQRRRFASEEAVDEVLTYFENARRGNHTSVPLVLLVLCRI
jgi:seryl-tRNA synthetase